MDNLTKDTTFPSRLRTAEEFSQMIYPLSLGYEDYVEELRDSILSIPIHHIPWQNIRCLFAIGRGYHYCNDLLTNTEFESGVYTDRGGYLLLLIHPQDSFLMYCLNRCSNQLQQLELYNTTFGSLVLSDYTSLEQLSIVRNVNLSVIHGLDKLTSLKKLDLSECSILKDLPGLERLTSLTKLALSMCDSLTGLPGLDKLTSLTELDLSMCDSLTELPNLKNLITLSYLDLAECERLTGLYGLENLSALTDLDLNNCNSLTELSGLEKLTSLVKLNLSACSSLTKLPEGLRNLKSLRCLSLRHMNLKALPDWLPEIAEGFSLGWDFPTSGKNKASVNLYGSTVVGVDMTIFEQPYNVIKEWFEKGRKGENIPLNEIKVVFLGDGEAGKSHTIARLMNDGGAPVDYMDQSTPGIVIKRKDYDLQDYGLGDRKFRVHYWDFGGQEIMHSMHRIFLTGRTMYVVLINARDDTQGARARYWLHNVKSFAPDAPVLLVLNKIDQNEKASVDEKDLRGRYPRLTEIVKLSAKEFSKEEFNEAFTKVLLEEIQKTGYLDAQWPVSWTKVKERLEKMTDHYIMGDAYQTICQECSVDSNQQNLLHWFNDLGISFCWCDEEEDYALEDHVILRPDWITNALYIILFNHLEGAHYGLIPHKSIYKLLKNARITPSIRCTLPDAKYSNGDIQYVLGVMRKFNLSFDDKDGCEFIPMLCQQNSTVDVQYYHKDEDVLEFNMDFDYLPDNLLHRLMVERHAELDMKNVWRKGARFEFDKLGYSAVVVIDGNTLRFFIRHTDAMHRPNTYLTMLKANVDRIVKKMGLKPPTNQLVYKLDGKRDVFDYENLKLRLEVGQTQELSTAHRRMIPIKDILNQSAPDGLENEQRLLDAIQEACVRIQNEPMYCLDPNGSNWGKEDQRNRRVRDDLELLGYHVSDQTQRGGGELDMRILNEQGKPWTIIEALRVSNGTKHEWNEHLNKLVGRYNTNGLPVLYLLAYVDAAPDTFAAIWKGYQSHIQTYNPGKYDCIADDFNEMDCSSQSFKAAKCRYACGDGSLTVYHIFARIPVQVE